LQFGRRYKIEIPDADVDAQFADMGATGMHMTSEQLTQAAGPGRRRFVHAQGQNPVGTPCGQNIVRGKYQGDLQIREKDVLAALQSDKPRRGKTGSATNTGFGRYCSSFRTAPPSSPKPARRTPKRCGAVLPTATGGLKYARTLRDVAVRDVHRQEFVGSPAGAARRSRQDGKSAT